MPRLIISSGSPRVASLSGTLTITPISAEQAGELIGKNRERYESLITYEETCEVLAVIASLPFFRRARTPKAVDLKLSNGDLFLTVTVKNLAREKERRSLGAYDLEFTLCEFKSHR